MWRSMDKCRDSCLRNAAQHSGALAEVERAWCEAMLIHWGRQETLCAAQRLPQKDLLPAQNCSCDQRSSLVEWQSGQPGRVQSRALWPIWCTDLAPQSGCVPAGVRQQPHPPGLTPAGTQPEPHTCCPCTAVAAMNGVHVLEASCLLQVSGSKVMSQAEREEYEDKRLKMRKAMGDKLHDEAAAAEVSGGLLHCLPFECTGPWGTDNANAEV